jgi:vitamin B12 transporter
LVRAYGAWHLRSNLDLRLRMENALDETYEAVNGFPSPGLAVYGGLDWRF